MYQISKSYRLVFDWYRIELDSDIDIRSIFPLIQSAAAAAAVAAALSFILLLLFHRHPRLFLIQTAVVHSRYQVVYLLAIVLYYN